MKVGLRTIAVLAAAVAAYGQNAASSNPPTITAKECQDLIYKMLKADDWTKTPGFHFEGNAIYPDYPEFYVVSPKYINPFGGSGMIRDFSVERATGDVWEFFKCGRYASPALLAAQKALRHRIGLTDAAYRSLQKAETFCPSGETPVVLKMDRPNFDWFRIRVKNQE